MNTIHLSQYQTMLFQKTEALSRLDLLVCRCLLYAKKMKECEVNGGKR